MQALQSAPASRRRRSPRAMTKLKLSEIWDKAAAELIQCKTSFGDRKAKEACALGAILYYQADQSVIDLNSFEGSGFHELTRLSYSEAISTFEKAVHDTIYS